MIIVDNISNYDNRIVIGANGVAKTIWQYAPDTIHERTTDRPLGCLKTVNESIVGYLLVDSDYTLELEHLNEALETEYATLEEFYATLNDNYLVI
jgi:hypothetical protein